MLKLRTPCQFACYLKKTEQNSNSNFFDIKTGQCVYLGYSYKLSSFRILVKSVSRYIVQWEELTNIRPCQNFTYLCIYLRYDISLMKHHIKTSYSILSHSIRK